MSETKPAYSSFGWFICILGALFYCYEYFLRIMPAVMTTDLMQAFSINATLLGNLAAFYYYAYTPMQLPVGVLMDRYGPKRLILFAIQVCGLGILLFGTSGQLYIAYLGRFLVGFGSAFAFVGVLKLASLWLPVRFFGFIAGATTALGMFGAIFGSLFLEKIVHISGWESTVKISAIAAFVLAMIISLAMPSHHRAPNKNIAALDDDLLSYRELAILFWSLCKNPVIWLNGFVGCMLYMSLSVFAELWAPKYLEVAHHIPSSEAVGASIIIFASWIVGGPLFGYFAKNDFRRSVYLLLFGAAITAIFSTILLLDQNLSYANLRIVLFLFGLGSSAEILVFNLACTMVDRRFAGTAIAFTNMLVMLGGFVFEPFVGKMLDVLWAGGFSAGIKTYTAHAFTVGLSVLPIGAALSIVALSVMLRYAPSQK